MIGDEKKFRASFSAISEKVLRQFQSIGFWRFGASLSVISGDIRWFFLVSELFL